MYIEPSKSVCEVSDTYLLRFLRYLKETFITNLSLKFEHGSDGVSTWSKFDGHHKVR